jgi:hypothetical protein
LLFSLHFFVVDFFGGRQLLVDVGERRVVVVGGVAAFKKNDLSFLFNKFY